MSLQPFVFAWPPYCYYWLWEIKNCFQSNVFVASFVENDQMFKESKRWTGQETSKQKQTHNDNATNTKAQLFYLLGK
jgi:hypothetical protein